MMHDVRGSRRDLGPLNLEERLGQCDNIPAHALDSLKDLLEEGLRKTFSRPSVNVEAGRSEDRLLEKSHRPRVTALRVGRVAT